MKPGPRSGPAFGLFLWDEESLWEGQGEACSLGKGHHRPVDAYGQGPAHTELKEETRGPARRTSERLCSKTSALLTDGMWPELALRDSAAGLPLKPKQVLFLRGQKLVGYLPKASRRSSRRMAPTKNLTSWGMKSRRRKDKKRRQSSLKLYLAFFTVSQKKKKSSFSKIPCQKCFCPLITDCNSGVLPLLKWHGLRWEA